MIDITKMKEHLSPSMTRLLTDKGNDNVEAVPGISTAFIIDNGNSVLSASCAHDRSAVVHRNPQNMNIMKTPDQMGEVTEAYRTLSNQCSHRFLRNIYVRSPPSPFRNGPTNGDPLKANLDERWDMEMDNVEEIFKKSGFMIVSS